MHVLSATSSTKFVDLQIQPWHWLVLSAVVAALIVADLWRHRDDHEPSTREAALESGFYVAMGLGFAGFVAYVFGAGATTEYLTGYVIEKSLSVDNVFVWAVIFASFSTPLKYQHRVLFWGYSAHWYCEPASCSQGRRSLHRSGGCFWSLAPSWYSAE